MTEMDLVGLQSAEASASGRRRRDRCPTATLQLVGLARPLVDRVDRLAGENDEAVICLHGERLVTSCDRAWR